jgi:hypothetical protein
METGVMEKQIPSLLVIPETNQVTQLKLALLDPKETREIKEIRAILGHKDLHAQLEASLEDLRSIVRMAQALSYPMVPMDKTDKMEQTVLTDRMDRMHRKARLTLLR